MCGRVGFFHDRQFLEAVEGMFVYRNSISKFVPSYNIAPSQRLATLLNTKEYRYTHFGLIPHWGKDDKFQPFNARAETIAEKPTFKQPFLTHRCIVPVNGYYEWKSDGEIKRPYWIFPTENDFFGIAAIYDTWTDKQSGAVITGTALITTRSNFTLEAIDERMPVILDPKDWALWLDSEIQDAEVLLPLLHPIKDSKAAFYEVAPAVGNIHNNSEELIQALDITRY